jgi:hypothetical protein
VRALCRESLKEPVDVRAFEKVGLRRRDPLDGNPGHLLTDGQSCRVPTREVLEEAHENSAAMIPRPDVILSLLLQRLEKPEHAIDSEIVDPESRERTAPVRRDKREEQPEGVPIGANRAGTEAFLHAEVVGEERVEVRPEIAGAHDGAPSVPGVA